MQACQFSVRPLLLWRWASTWLATCSTPTTWMGRLGVDMPYQNHLLVRRGCHLLRPYTLFRFILLPHLPEYDHNLTFKRVKAKDDLHPVSGATKFFLSSQQILTRRPHPTWAYNYTPHTFLLPAISDLHPPHNNLEGKLFLLRWFLLGW